MAKSVAVPFPFRGGSTSIENLLWSLFCWMMSVTFIHFILCKGNKKNATDATLNPKGSQGIMNKAANGMIFLKESLDETE